MTQANYQSRTKRLLKGFSRLLSRSEPLLLARYGKEQTAALVNAAVEEYKLLIPQIPYIGKRNPFQIFLFPTVRCLAIYRAILRQGGNLEEAGQLIYAMSEVELAAMPVWLRRMIAYLWFSPWFVRRIRKRAQTSQLREYPASFVMHYIEGDGVNYDYGVDYTECANCKFLRTHGAIELLPYICATDRISSEMLGWGLSRTMTIADGDEKCDFRFKKDGKTSV